VTGGWRKIHNEKLHDLYPWPSIIRIMKSRRMMGSGHVARMGATRNAQKLLVGKPKGKGSIGRSTRRCVGIIKMDIVDSAG
jgi:hypothetical protein